MTKRQRSKKAVIRQIERKKKYAGQISNSGQTLLNRITNLASIKKMIARK